MSYRRSSSKPSHRIFFLSMPFAIRSLMASIIKEDLPQRLTPGIVIIFFTCSGSFNSLAFTLKGISDCLLAISACIISFLFIRTNIQKVSFLQGNFFKIIHFLSVHLSILNLAPRAAADISAHVNHKNLIRHINLPLVHIIQHLLGPFRPHLIIPAMPKQSNGNHYKTLKSQLLLRRKKFLLKLCASAQRHHFILSYHIIATYLLLASSFSTSP